MRCNIQVALEDGVEVWLKRLKNGIEGTLRQMLSQAIVDINSSVPLEDLVYKVKSQSLTIVLFLSYPPHSTAMGGDSTLASFRFRFLFSTPVKSVGWPCYTSGLKSVKLASPS